MSLWIYLRTSFLRLLSNKGVVAPLLIGGVSLLMTVTSGLLTSSFIHPMAVFSSWCAEQKESKAFFCQSVWCSLSQLVSNLLIVVWSAMTLLILCSLFQCSRNLVALGPICYDFVDLTHFMPLALFANTRDFLIGQPNQWILCCFCSWNVFESVTGKKLSYPALWTETHRKVSAWEGSRKIHYFWDVCIQLDCG